MTYSLQDNFKAKMGAAILSSRLDFEIQLSCLAFAIHENRNYFLYFHKS